MKQVPFIGIEGPIGVGKTSLAQRLAAYFHFHLLLEIVEENPFLGKFYENMEEWSFQTEMFFLCNRYKQLEELKENILDQHKPVIADYHIFKNLLFAKRTLTAAHFDKFSQIYHILTNDIPMPNIIIYLHAGLDTLLKRIKERARDVEQAIQPAYLQQLAMDYEAFINTFEKRFPAIPIIRIDGDKTDFVSNEADLNKIIKKVEKVIKQSCILTSKGNKT